MDSVILSRSELERVKEILNTTEEALKEQLSEMESALTLVDGMIGLFDRRLSQEKKDLISEKRQDAESAFERAGRDTKNFSMFLDKLYPEREKVEPIPVEEM